METLPKRTKLVENERLVNYYCIDKCIFTIKDIDDFMINYIGADCWGLTCDDEIIFNSYTNTSILNNIQNNMVRTALLDNIHANFIVYLYRNNKPSKIKIHMFGSNGYDVVIDFMPITRTFQVSILEE